MNQYFKKLRTIHKKTHFNQETGLNQDCFLCLSKNMKELSTKEKVTDGTKYFKFLLLLQKEWEQELLRPVSRLK